MSSSFDRPLTNGATIYVGLTTGIISDHRRGSPVRLPAREVGKFVNQFNEIYSVLGWSMTAEQGNLESKRCKPCEGGVAPLNETEIAGLLSEVPGWTLRDDKAAIGRKINAGTFAKAIGIVEKVASLAEQEQHHPDLHLTGYRHLAVVLTTHAIGGLSENDFILAAKINAALQP